MHNAAPSLVTEKLYFLLSSCFFYLREAKYTKSSTMRREDLGKKGEGLAAEWLLKREFKILHRNWRHNRCEVDIIAHRNKILHFIEVKTRSSKKYGYPEESI